MLQQLGDSRQHVDLYRVKGFDERYAQHVGERIGVLKTLVQNRDGAAIRHATRRLSDQPAKSRLLILLSDGKPYDRDYERNHAMADTRMALLEAKRSGVQTFCITIDRQAEDYLQSLYAPGRYTIIDDVQWLPERLPRIYQRVTS